MRVTYNTHCRVIGTATISLAQGCEKRSGGKQVQRKRSSFLRAAPNNGEEGKEGETSIILVGVVDR